MASFDIINAVGNSYATLWRGRQYLLKLAFVPVLVKFITISFVLSLNMEDESGFRTALIYIPAFFVEGWMLAHWVRWIVLGQKWPYRPSGNEAQDLQNLNDRARGVLSGMIVYVLIQMLISGTWALSTMMPMSEEIAENPPPEMQALSIVGIVFILWSFRYLWVFIPASVNHSILSYIKDTGHPFMSLRMIGLWLVCCVPGFVVMMSFTFPVIVADGEGVSHAAKLLGAFAHVCLEVTVNLLAVGGIAFALRDLYARKNEK